MWRAYGKGSGYAIVFRTKEFCDILLHEESKTYLYGPSSIGDVVYGGDDNGFRREFSSLLAEIRKYLLGLLAGNPQATPELYAHFTSSVARYKHRGFAEEAEVRAMLAPVSQREFDRLKLREPENFKQHKAKSPKAVHFRDGLVPYLKISPLNGKLPISSIIVGPHAEKEARREKLERYLELKNLNISVAVSETPFA
ncbi:DUF2971 domain-containing protein [Hyphomicrobium sp.]|uniref:DUF2971 domain-containing protein n=1 Tax=Hyphomicrobium sp. TaxID=82 RepID=UPI003F7164DE